MMLDVSLLGRTVCSVGLTTIFGLLVALGAFFFPASGAAFLLLLSVDFRCNIQTKGYVSDYSIEICKLMIDMYPIKPEL